MTADVEAERWVPMSLRRADGERGLLRALLMEAVRCALGEAGGRQAKRAQLAAEARRWITRANVGEPFAFENVCAWLGLPAHRLRRFVLEQVELLRPSAPVVARQGASRHPGALSARLREDRNARIREFRATGWKPRDIAERFDLSYASVIAICSEDGEEEIEESEGALEAAAS